MFGTSGWVQAKPRGSGSLHERHLPGELRRTSLRPARHRTMARALFPVAIELLCIGAIPALSYLGPPTPTQIIAAQSGRAPEPEPQAPVEAQEPERTEPLLVPQPIASEPSLALSEAPVGVPNSTHLFGETGLKPEPLYTGSISSGFTSTPEQQATTSLLPADESPSPLTAEEAPADGQPPSVRAPTDADLVDLNTAGPEALNGLGIGLVARQVVANRPYDSPEDLLARRVLTRKDFDRIRGKVTARQVQCLGC